MVSKEVGKIMACIDGVGWLQFNSSMSCVTLAGHLGTEVDQPSYCKAHGSSSMTWIFSTFLTLKSVADVVLGYIDCW